MPSPHRRIGLVADEGIESALKIFRQAAGAAPDASLARRAVLEGALVEALMTATERGSGEQERAAVLVRELRELLPVLRLPANPYGQTALDYADSFDADDTVPR